MSKSGVYLDMMYSRLLADRIQKISKSILLLGPRQTGKSTLIKSLQPDHIINLASEQAFLDYSAQPDLLTKVIQLENPKTVFIDEVQRIPSLLNTVQTIIDDNPRKHRFFLTGSSARKLKRGKANLLPGRVVGFQLGPLTSEELGEDLNLEEALIFGTLPGIVSEKRLEDRQDILRTYSSTYLKEEIQAEALTKQIEGFARFLFVAASKSGEFLDFTKIGTQAAINQKTSSRFFEILEDTLIVNRLNTFSGNETRRLVRHPKFYFFDNGVLNGLLKNFVLSEDRKGSLFEHFIMNQIITANLLFGDRARLSTYRTESGAEVDLIIERDNDLWSIEIKSSKRLLSEDFSGLRSFAKLIKRKHRSLIVYDGTKGYRERSPEGSIDILPWKKALREVTDFLR